MAEQINKAKMRGFCLIVLLCLTVAGCQQGGGGAKQTVKAPTPVLSEFEKDLNYVRKAQLAHTYIFARKDGAPFEPADKEFLGRNTPPETSYRLITDGERRAIISSNFDLAPENKEALAKRFTIEQP